MTLLPNINKRNSYAKHQSNCHDFIENNKAFKIIKDNLVKRHQEHLNRPNFNIAGIAPIDEKFIK